MDYTTGATTTIGSYTISPEEMKILSMDLNKALKKQEDELPLDKALKVVKEAANKIKDEEAKEEKPNKKKDTIVPILLTSSSSLATLAMTPEEIGNKAANLFKLAKDGFNVPLTYVIPCKYSLSKPNITLPADILYSGVKWAVRSGAPVSMPGLLETKLNVMPYDIEKRIKEVWESWTTPNAIAYREENGISHDIGTAVLIQRMIDPHQSGVAFTNDPGNMSNQSVFIPVIEYVEGSGDKLVGGENSGFEADGSEPWHGKVLKGIQLMHEKYGPSDIEFVIQKSIYGGAGNVWFVQQRALKFVKSSITVEDDPNETRKTIAKFKPIGDGSKIWARVSPAWNFVPGTAVYLESFKPEYYDLMMNTKAILTKTGGTTCHAAIVAREMCLPALSKVTNLQVLLDAPHGVILNGSTGFVYEATEEDAKEGAATQHQAKKITIVPPKRPNFKLTDHNWTGDYLLYRFYYVMDAHAQGKMTLERRNEIVEEIAHILSTYMYVICCGEMRHAKSKEWGSEMIEIVRQLRIRGVKIPGDNGIKSPSREAFFLKGGIPEPKSVKRTVEILEYLRMGFLNSNWPSSFGGKKWAKITSIVLDYFKASTNAALFVDSSFNLQHNCGTMFCKFGWMGLDLNIQSMLNYKAKSFKDLEVYMKEFNKEGLYTQFAKKESLLDSLITAPIAEDEEEELQLMPLYWGNIKPVSFEPDVEPEEDEETNDVDCDCELCTGIANG